MTNFQFYLNSPLRGRFMLGPADGFFPKPFSAFYLSFIRLQLRHVWFFGGLWVAVHRCARCIGASQPCCPMPAWRFCPLSGAYFSCANKSRGLEQ